ncbi:hypothetical protein O181_010625 [Austropuccinia psidii MF-1]|uniref:Uncharacterized protein n=1 Tax=Austropuccinia psidii MF-1 TaxID=1389203 RepID=A0A9Q3BU91_9BASI|nr:hypothetical protein [Austropuccinia psidii MF-1]
MASAAHGPWDLSGPFLPNFNEAKGRQRGGLEATSAHFGQKAQTAQIGPRTQVTRGNKPPSIRGFLSRSGKPLAQLNGPKPVGASSGAYMVLYTIMHHFSSSIQCLWFQDSIMSFQITPPSQSLTSKEGFSPSVLQSMVATRRPFEDPNSLAFQVVAISSQDSSRVNFKRLLIIRTVFKASSTSALLRQLDWPIQAVFS